MANDLIAGRPPAPVRRFGNFGRCRSGDRGAGSGSRPIRRCAGRRAAASWRPCSRGPRACGGVRRCNSTVTTVRPSANGVGGKARGIGAVERDALRRRHWCVDSFERRWRKGAGKIQNIAMRQHAESGVEVIEARIGEGERNATDAELPLDHFAGGRIGAETAAHPENDRAGDPRCSHRRPQARRPPASPQRRR